MSTRRQVTDAAIAAVAGYVGTKAMERFNTAAYQLEPEADRQREESVRPGPPFQLAAENLANRILGVELDQEQARKVGMIFHQLGGFSAVPAYVALRRARGWRPVTAGLLSGAGLSLLLDELFTPAIGASAPNTDYPLSTHVRAFAAHLIYGLAVAGVVEAGWAISSERPPNRPWSHARLPTSRLDQPSVRGETRWPTQGS